MVSMTKQMNFFVTNTEIEALLLECNLIKRHKPRFNIILRDDKSFPYILINKEYEYPRIQKYRGAKKIKGDYFGPFVSPSVALARLGVYCLGATVWESTIWESTTWKSTVLSN